MTPWNWIEVAFWISAAGCAASYALYPVLLHLAPRRPPHGADAAWELPRLSVIVTARNEERRLEQKLRNTLALDYPRERLQIIVASDASEDRTDEIARSFAGEGVTLARTALRGGKEAAQAHAIAQSTGEIIVFTDVTTRLDTDALRRIASHFADPTIGAVSSEDRVEPGEAQAGASGEGAYVRYEMWLRRLESERAGLVGLSGSLFAVRRRVAERWPIDVPSDISAALRTASLGLRAIADPRLFGYYSDLRDASREYGRKVRTVIRGMAAVAHMRQLLNPRRFGWYALQLWGHKIFRWLTPVFLLLTALLSMPLAFHSPCYLAILALQLIFYGAAALAALAPALQRFRLFRLTYYFTQVHLALLDAGWRFLRNERVVVWNPSVR